jgi:hypothetical protein
MLRAWLPSFRRYGLAVLGVTAASLLGQLEPFRRMDFWLFFFAIAIVARYAGVRAGVFAAALSILALDVLFLPPLYSLALSDVQDVLRLLIFAVGVLGAMAVFRWTSWRPEFSPTSYPPADAASIYYWHRCFNALVECLQDRAAFLLDACGHVVSWSQGAKVVTRHAPLMVCGRHFSCLFPPEAVRRGDPDRFLQQAVNANGLEEDMWLMRADKSPTHARVIVTPLRGATDHPAERSLADQTSSADDALGFLILLQEVADNSPAMAEAGPEPSDAIPA